MPTFLNTKYCQLSLNLTNPAKNNEKFGDTLLAMLEIYPIKQEEFAVKQEEEEEEKLDIIEDPDDDLAFEEQEDTKQEQIGQKCLQAVNLIDDILRDDIDDMDDFDFLDPTGLNLTKFNSYQAEDGTRISCVNEEEVKGIKQRALEEKEQSLKRFQELLQDSQSLSQSQNWEKIEE